MAAETKRCWACEREIDGPVSHTLQLDERWKGNVGSGIHVTLDHDCARRVRELLYKIQDEASPAHGPASTEAGNG